MTQPDTQTTTEQAWSISPHQRPTLNAQTTNEILMIQPTGFHFNFKTAIDNNFQQLPPSITRDEAIAIANNREQTLAENPDLAERVQAIDSQAQQQALYEFNQVAQALRAKLVTVYVIIDNPNTDTPDSIFPNNPISFHQQDEGTAVQHLMRVDNRKLETDLPIIKTLTQTYGFQISKVVDLRNTTDQEGNETPLEGTGSMVIDRANGIVYACFSNRTTKEGLEVFNKELKYKKVVTFTAKDSANNENQRTDIYHTNVMMSVGNKFAVICFESIPDINEREVVRKSLQDTGKEIIEISLDQMNSFAGNMLEIQNSNGDPLIAMSQTARNSLTSAQIASLERFGEIVSEDISTIETNGGGSMRCMLAEIHLPKN